MNQIYARLDCVENLTRQRHDRDQTENQQNAATVDSCFELVGSRQHGVAQQKVEHQRESSVLPNARGSRFRMVPNSGIRPRHWDGCLNLGPSEIGYHVHLVEHSTRVGVLLFAVLHRADESQPARNSCPRLPHFVDSRFGLYHVAVVLSSLRSPALHKFDLNMKYSKKKLKPKCIQTYVGLSLSLFLKYLQFCSS